MKRIVSVVMLSLIGLTLTGMLAETTVGPTIAADGVQIRQRAGREGETICADLTGKYAEAAERNQVFSISTVVAGTTIVAANNTPVAAAGATILTLYNPVGSGKSLEVITVTANWLSGTPAAGGIVYNYAANQLITATQNATPASHSGNGNSVAKGYTQTALTGGLGVMTFLRAVPGCAPFAGAIAATSVGINCYENTEGQFVLPPGSAFTIASAGTGVTAVLQASITYREGAPN